MPFTKSCRSANTLRKGIKNGKLILKIIVNDVCCWVLIKVTNKQIDNVESCLSGDESNDSKKSSASFVCHQLINRQ